MKVDVSFVSSIIDNYIRDLEEQKKVFNSPSREISYSVKTLKNLKASLEQFIVDANNLGDKK
jgi:hypothetical protein